jgi:hypothetical protein
VEEDDLCRSGAADNDDTGDAVTTKMHWVKEVDTAGLRTKFAEANKQAAGKLNIVLNKKQLPSSLAIGSRQVKRKAEPKSAPSAKNAKKAKKASSHKNSTAARTTNESGYYKEKRRQQRGGSVGEGRGW